MIVVWFFYLSGDFILTYIHVLTLDLKNISSLLIVRLIPVDFGVAFRSDWSNSICSMQLAHQVKRVRYGAVKGQ